MELARHGTGVHATVAALVSQIHPVFMLPPLGTSLFGAALAGEFTPRIAAVHLGAVFFGLYTAHVKDGYVDFHLRGEDADHPLTADGCRIALGLATVGFAVCTMALGLLVGIGAVLLTLPGWIIGYLHAPQLDTTLVGVTVGYPTGIAFALLGGYYVQTGMLAPAPLAFAIIFTIVLSGVKIVDDASDVAYDRSIQKRTPAVVFGPARARRGAYALMAVGLVCVVGLSVSGVFPRSAAVAPIAFAGVAILAYRAGQAHELATKLLVRGAYLFLAVLVAATWFRPLA